MQQSFQYRLAQATGVSTLPSVPAVPQTIDASLHQACLFAVERCLCAFTNPGMIGWSKEVFICPLPCAVYVDWDYESYCEDCANRHLSNGGNSRKEEALREEWEPKHRDTLRIRRAATIIDSKNRIIGWMLPEILLPSYQVQQPLHWYPHFLLTCASRYRISCTEQ